MALDIDKKVYRNLQEQVSWLTTTVAEIIDVTDAKKLEELTTELEGYKDDFEGYADIMSGYANTMGGYATTMQGYANTMGGYATTMQGYASQVDTWTNNISGAALSVVNSNNITPLTVKQQVANFEAAFVFPSVPGNLTPTTIYNRVEEINNVLYVIYNIKLTNSTGSAKTYAAGSRILVTAVNLNNAVGSKLVDFEGDAATASKTVPALIAYFDGFLTKNITDPNNIDIPYERTIRTIIKNNNPANQIGISMNANESFTIADGESVYISARIALTLL